jgi:hypothetical protein
MVKDPVWVVVPEISPLLVSSASPLGSEPELRLHLYGVFPPTAEIGFEYGAPLLTGERLVVVIVRLEGPGVTVTAAVALMVESVLLVAVTVTVVIVDTLGAVNAPCGEIVPELAVQVTAVSAVLMMVAEKVWCAPGAKTTLAGETSTALGGMTFGLVPD